MLVKPVIKPCKMMLIGESPTTADDAKGAPFMGAPGQELMSILEDAGIKRYELSLSLVFKERPPNNDLQNWGIPRKDLARERAPGRPFNPIPVRKGVVAPSRVHGALEVLQAEIRACSPNVIVACGNVALAALTGAAGVGKLRGSLHFTNLPGLPSIKVLPTYAPAMVLRQYEVRSHVVMDFMKAKRESESPTASLLNRKIYIEPTLDDLAAWVKYLTAQPFLASDIETRRRQITCIGFSPSPTEAFVIPFWLNGKNYWQSVEEEMLAYKAVKEICECEAVKIGQNFMYDSSYLFSYSIFTKNASEDTMLKHHALYPALPKSLAFLGSLYCNERAWKQWRSRSDETFELKREE